MLTSSGRFISITFAQPHFRKSIYAREHYGWSIRTETFGDGFHFFFYVMTKGQPLSPDDVQLVKKFSLEGKSPTQPETFHDVDDDDSYLNSIEMWLA